MPDDLSPISPLLIQLGDNSSVLPFHIVGFKAGADGQVVVHTTGGATFITNRTPQEIAGQIQTGIESVIAGGLHQFDRTHQAFPPPQFVHPGEPSAEGEQGTQPAPSDSGDLLRQAVFAALPYLAQYFGFDAEQVQALSGLAGGETQTQVDTNPPA